MLSAIGQTTDETRLCAVGDRCHSIISIMIFQSMSYLWSVACLAIVQIDAMSVLMLHKMLIDADSVSILPLLFSVFKF